MRNRPRTLSVLLLLVLGAAVACDGDGTPSAAPTGSLTAEPLGPTGEPISPGPTETVSPGPTASPSPTGPREPTDADRARFVASYRPGGTSDMRNLAIDLDGDEQKEIVFAYVVDAETRSQVDVADWNGTEYVIADQAPGGPADELADLQVRDINADGIIEVAAFQTVGASGNSVTLWAAGDGGRLVGLPAHGDCFDGRNTYGDTGAEIADRDGDGAGEIHATCQDEDLPAPLWPDVVYVWQDDAYRCDHREQPDGPDAPCEPSGTGEG